MVMTSSKKMPVATIAGKYDRGLELLLKQLSHIDLTDAVYDEEAYLGAHGGYCDVFIAKSRRHGGMTVAVKRLRVHILHHKDVAKMLFREITIWSALNHPNVLPLVGYVMHGKYPALVSEWMVNGTMKSYLEDHPEVSAMSMAKGIAAGLSHLHELHIVHSDLKSDNILMSEEGRPLLADFGISRIMSASLSVTTTTAAPKGSVRWMAIELLMVDLEEDRAFAKPAVHTKMTDVWSFGMVLYELLTNSYPYAQFRHEVQVSIAIINGQKPDRPKMLRNREEDLLWLICEKCWHSIPSHRPEMARLRDVLELEPVSNHRPTSPSTECSSLMDRLQQFVLWYNPQREVVWEERLPIELQGDLDMWKIIFSDITLLCARTGYRDKKNLYQVIEVESVLADTVNYPEQVYRLSPVPERYFIPQYHFYPFGQPRNSSATWKKIDYKDPISFEVIMPNGLLSLGIPMRECLSGSIEARLPNLYDGDKPAFEEHANPDIIYICFGWPGYNHWKMPFDLRPKESNDHDRPPAPRRIITKAEIARLAARAVKVFIDTHKDQIPDLGGDEARWRVGNGYVEAAELVLCGLFDRSEGHWQASICIDKPSFISASSL